MNRYFLVLFLLASHLHSSAASTYMILRGSSSSRSRDSGSYVAEALRHIQNRKNADAAAIRVAHGQDVIWLKSVSSDSNYGEFTYRIGDNEYMLYARDYEGHWRIIIYEYSKEAFNHYCRNTPFYLSEIQ